jgi:hypothetical protein
MLRAFLSLLLAFAVPLSQAESLASQSHRDLTPAAKRTLTESGSSQRLPVRKVVLYKNGVGYFEHAGRVRGNGEISIDFTSAQLNDVLKSLTVLDLGGGKITGVSYNSTAPLSERLKTLRLPLGEDITLSQFLASVRGSRVEVRSGATTVSGRLLGVEERDDIVKDNKTVKHEYVSVITDAGEVRSFELTPALSVRLADRDLKEEVSKYMGMIAATREQDVRRMSIATAGSGERELFASYISEVPVWKSTYRIVLPSKAGAKPILQGWAIVDNTVGEDWDNVELSLVAGAPQSFIENLSQPYYARRPVVEPRESAMLTPQTHEGTMQNNVEVTSASPGVDADKSGQATRNDRLDQYAQLKMPRAMPVPPPPADSSLRRELGVPPGAMGAVLGGVGATSGPGYGGGAFRTPQSNALALDQAIAAQRAETQTADLGDLFEYKLNQPVTIRKNQSAMVPIMQANVDAERVTVVGDNTPRPLRAIWLTNSSGLTLDGGAFNVIDENTFAGEGLLDPIKPGEKRLLSYAVDLGLRVESKRNSDSERVSRITIDKGILRWTNEVREHRTYTIRNENSDARTVIVEQAARPGVKLAKGSPQPAETSQNLNRFRVNVEPKKTATLKIDEYQPVVTTYALTNLTKDNIAFFLQQKALSPEVEKALRQIVAQKNKVSDIDTQIQSQKSQMENISQDQQRLRENLKALKGSAEEKALVQRYTRELDTQEDQMDSLRKSGDDLRKQREAAQADLDKLIQGLTVNADESGTAGGQAD